MSDFSIKSRANLIGCHSDLQKLAHRVIRIHDCSVLTGFRAEDEQNKLYEEGFSKVQYPNSKHNTMPSRAIDIVPYPIDYEDTKRFYYFAGIVMGVAREMNIKLIWGGCWKNDNRFNANRWNDLAHFELL